MLYDPSHAETDKTDQHQASHSTPLKRDDHKPSGSRQDASKQAAVQKPVEKAPPSSSANRRDDGDEEGRGGAETPGRERRDSGGDTRDSVGEAVGSDGEDEEDEEVDLAFDETDHLGERKRQIDSVCVCVCVCVC